MTPSRIREAIADFYYGRTSEQVLLETLHQEGILTDAEVEMATVQSMHPRHKILIKWGKGPNQFMISIVRREK